MNNNFLSTTLILLLHCSVSNRNEIIIFGKGKNILLSTTSVKEELLSSNEKENLIKIYKNKMTELVLAIESRDIGKIIDLQCSYVKRAARSSYKSNKFPKTPQKLNEFVEFWKRNYDRVQYNNFYEIPYRLFHYDSLRVNDRNEFLFAGDLIYVEVENRYIFTITIDDLMNSEKIRKKNPNANPHEVIYNILLVKERKSEEFCFEEGYIGDTIRDEDYDNDKFD